VNEKWNVDYDSGFNSGMEWEQSRIIKLLENSDSACSAWAIALIKGETK
jgi:hypothetical protein